MRIRSLLPLVVVASVLAVAAPARAQVPLAAARDAEPVVVQGAQLPAWSRLSAVAAPGAWPQGAANDDLSELRFGERDAHAGTVVVPPDARTGVPTDEIAAFRWTGSRFEEVPVQVDERFPYILANPDSDFGIYSAVDEELTYAWDVENWKKTAGTCEAEYPQGESATPDPAAGLDNDDEIAFMASDAGELAPPDAKGPVGTLADRQQIAIADPLDPTNTRFVYLFRRPGGSSFDAGNGYVSYERDENADQWIDRTFFDDDDPEKLGTSNTGYGPNLKGTVCRGEAVAQSNDRFVRDGVTVSTDTYEWRASGRWMIRGMRITKPGVKGTYGPDLIDRWKGRAFQQSPDSSISLVGFEDEQVNWEANSALLGERTGPVRAIRETWGADSGTNVTKTETFYRDAVQYRYRLRVHPIPPDGLYQAWDYNKGVAVKYYNAVKTDGVDIDGVPDDAGNINTLPDGRPAFFDVPDPTFGLPLAMLNWQQVSGREDSGSLVYITEAESPTSFENPLVFPYYNDDKCFDDGTGDDPVARPWPGEASTDQRVRDGYAALAGKPYDQVTCDEKQGAWGAHGVHFLLTNDTDNAFQSKTLTELDATEWQFAVPTSAPQAVGEPYAQVVRAPLQTAAVPLTGEAVQASDLEITEPLSGQTTDEVTLRAVLTGGGSPIAGAVVRFVFQGDTFDATTNGQGVATAAATVEGPSGTTPVTASFEGNGDHAGSADEAEFTVEREDTSVAFTATRRTPRDLSTVKVAVRDEDSGDPVAGLEVQVWLGGKLKGTATTDAAGTATAVVTVRKKVQTMEVRVVGNATYNGAVATARYNPKKGASTGS